MSWDVELPLILRNILDDLKATPKYTDDRLSQLILVSAQLVQQEIGFDTNYVVDIENFSLSPDPTDRLMGTRNDNFVNLVVLKSACLLSMSELRSSSLRSIGIRDGSSAIDLKQNLPGNQLIVRNFCDLYNDAKQDFLVNGGSGSGGGGVGQAIVGPYKIFPNSGFGTPCYRDPRVMRPIY